MAIFPGVGTRVSYTLPSEAVFQSSWRAAGRRPYFGQAGWFLLFHPEPAPGALERYRKEILRVWGVLEHVLAKQAWLVAGKCTIADLSFIP